MTKVLNSNVSFMGADGKSVALLAGTRWTEELGERITNPNVWSELPEAEDQVETEAPGEAEVESSDSEDVDESAEAPTAGRYKGMRKPELRAALEERGLDASGTVNELVARLVEDDAATS